MCIGIGVALCGVAMWFLVPRLRDLHGLGERPGYPAVA
jgi:hypothetical protein